MATLKEVTAPLNFYTDDEVSFIKEEAKSMNLEDFFEKHPVFLDVLIKILEIVIWLPFTGKLVDMGLDVLLTLLQSKKK